MRVCPERNIGILAASFPSLLPRHHNSFFQPGISSSWCFKLPQAHMQDKVRQPWTETSKTNLSSHLNWLSHLLCTESGISLTQQRQSIKSRISLNIFMGLFVSALTYTFQSLLRKGGIWSCHNLKLTISVLRTKQPSDF